MTDEVTPLITAYGKILDSTENPPTKIAVGCRKNHSPETLVQVDGIAYQPQQYYKVM